MNEVERLTEVCKESNAVCVCGCSAKDHEQYGDEGEACGNEDHECIRTSRAVASIVKELRNTLKLKQAEIDGCIPELARAVKENLDRAVKAEHRVVELEAAMRDGMPHN